MQATRPDADEIFSQVGESFRQVLDHRLFTVTRILPGETEVERIYSTDQTAYPLAGRKPVVRDAWYEQVIERRQCFIANSPAEFAPYFSDYQLIVALGLGSVINVPVVTGEHLFGTLNFLDRAGAYESIALEVCQTLAAASVKGFRWYQEQLAETG